jgi:two-component sensor histidine kinase
VFLTGPLVVLALDLSVPVGMALDELATNAVRHGALGDPDGRLEVAWSVEDEGKRSVTAALCL